LTLELTLEKPLLHLAIASTRPSLEPIEVSVGPMPSIWTISATSQMRGGGIGAKVF
jgi:hypothetical protein